MARILVIEPDTSLSKAIVSILEIAGHETATAQDGRVGLAHALEFRPDLILCEVKVPHLDGFDMLAAIRRDATVHATPIVLLTSHLPKSEMRKGQDLGVSGFLIKPFTESELLRKLETSLLG